MSSAVEQLREQLSGAERIVAFTGAGISTESGIPDFRSPGGTWSRVKPIEFQDFVSSKEMRREAWRRKVESEHTLGAAQPNRGHQALFALYQAGKLSSIITQNVDGLHQASGLPADRVIELHGNATYASCLSCQQRYEPEPLLVGFRETGEPPECERCGGIVKSATISFGQPMPADAMRRAEEETVSCDLFLVLGTSLVVYPAAGFPLIAKRCRARLVIVNREPTEQDGLADLVVHDEIGVTLGDAVEGLG